MDAWLKDRRRQYEIFLGLSQLLLNRGFNPLPVELYAAESVPTDYTPPIMNFLRSFGEDLNSPILKVFSTGPISRPGQPWTEAIDVEWIGSSTTDAQEAVLMVIKEIALWLIAQGLQHSQLTMVFGDVGLVRECARLSGLSEDVAATLITNIRRGYLSEVNALLSAVADPLIELFRPQPTAKFRSLISNWVALPEAHPDVMGPWQTLWDLSLIGPRQYHVGLNFSLYHPRSGRPLLNGGAFEITGKKEPMRGIGFTLYLDAVEAAIQEVEDVT